MRTNLVKEWAAQLERFVFAEVDRRGISQPIRKLLDYFAETIDKFYGANMLSRVAYGFYHPARLAELQASIADPLVRGLEQSGADKWSIGGRVLAEAARNLDVEIPQMETARIDLANPRQALQDVATLVTQSHSHLRLAFESLTPAARTELKTSLPLLLRPMRWLDAPVVRARQARMQVDYMRLFAAASAMTAWTVSSAPPPHVPATAPVPGELADAVRGAVSAVEKISERWYVYGGPGASEYDMSRIDVVIDPRGDDVYRYPREERPRVQLILDWSGNDIYPQSSGAQPCSVGTISTVSPSRSGGSD